MAAAEPRTTYCISTGAGGGGPDACGSRVSSVNGTCAGTRFMTSNVGKDAAGCPPDVPLLWTTQEHPGPLRSWVCPAGAARTLDGLSQSPLCPTPRWTVDMDRVPALVRHVRTPYAPAVGAVVFFWLSSTPALLPRSTVFQVLVASVAAIGGYGLGALLGWVVRSCGGRLAGHRRRMTWRATGPIAAIGTALTLWAYLRWENQLRNLVGVPHVGMGSALLTLVVAVLLFVVFLVLARAIRASGRVLSRILPARVAVVVGAVFVALLATCSSPTSPATVCCAASMPPSWPSTMSSAPTCRADERCATAAGQSAAVPRYPLRTPHHVIW